MTKVLEHIEFETKYRVKLDQLHPFKELVEALEESKTFQYVQGPDVYFDSPEGLARYRKEEFSKTNRAEVTFKDKPKGAKNNIMRKEINWRVDKTPAKDIRVGLEMRGFTFDFEIYKTCHIYKLADVTLVFYMVRDVETRSMEFFIEIEVDEDKPFTEAQSWDLIKKYEEILAPIGITSRNRLKKSLYEMYTRTK